MITWTLSQSGLDKMKVRACLLDILLLQDCLNDYDDFEHCLDLIEEGKDKGPWNLNLTNKILEGIHQMNWDGYFD